MNKDYDLGNFDKDDILIGDKLVLPLGSTTEITIDQLIDINEVSEIVKDPQGNYSIRYANKMDISVTEIKINDLSISAGKEIPKATIPTLSNVVAELPPFPLYQTDANFSFGNIPEVTSVDSILFNTADPAKSVCAVTVSTQGIDATAAEIYLDVTIRFPKGFLPVQQSLFSITPDGIYQLHLLIPFDKVSGGKTETILFNMRKLALNNSAGTLSVGASLIVKRALSVAPSPTVTPKVDLGIAFQKIDFTAIYGTVSYTPTIAPISLDLSDISELFGPNSTLSFYNPHVLFACNSNTGAEFRCQADLAAWKAGQKIASINPMFVIDKAPAPGVPIIENIWIGPKDPMLSLYKWVEADINALLRNTPDQIVMAPTVSLLPAVGTFLPPNPQIKLDYTLEVPFAAGKDFSISFSEILKGVFDSGINKTFFSTGKAEIFGKASNKLPFALFINLVICDENMNPVGIVFPEVKLAGSPDGSVVKTDISFSIKAEDMSKMQQARNIEIRMTAASSEELEGIPLNANQSIQLELMLKKEGGISIK